MPFSVITDSSALAWLKTSKDQSPCFQRWWGYISSFVFTIQHRPGARIVTEDALSRRPDMEDTTLEDDMLSLPDPDDFSLPGPSGLAPPSTLTAALILPSHIKPPMTDNGVLVQYDVPDTPEYSADADIACAPPGAAVVPDDLFSTGAGAGGQAQYQADSAPPVGPSTPLVFVTTEILDRAFFGPVVGPCPEFGMPGACTLSDTLSREDGAVISNQ